MESTFWENIKICETETCFNVMRDRAPNNPPSTAVPSNVLFSRKFQNISSIAVKHTFDYIFHKFKKGIYVKIKDGELVSYIPFDNMNYTNEFSHLLKPPPGYASLHDYLSSMYQTPKLPPERWYANNSMFRTEDFKGQNNVEILWRWLSELCATTTIHDIEFFINRRDFPLMKEKPVEPYDHIFGPAFPLLSHRYEKYAPIISFSNGPTFADVLMPTFEDWARVWYQENGETVPGQHRAYPPIEPTPWEEKKPVAFFRGQTTGSGFDQTNNQRLRAYVIARDRPDILDVQFTRFSYRFRKHKSSPYIHVQEFPGQFTKAAYVSAQEQSTYKFILNLEGHVAAYRLSYELSFGSCILLAGSRWKIWYSHLLKPWEHYVPVKEDLSDLVKMVEWCLTHDRQCQIIAQQAREFYHKYLNKAAMISFCEKTLNDLASFCGPFAHLPRPAFTSALDPWEIAKTNPLRQNISIAFEKITPAQKFDRSIEALQAVDIILGRHSRDITFQTLHNEIKFTNIAGCLVGKEELTDPGAAVARQVGWLCLNKILHDIPNFLYTFPPQEAFFSELIPGVSFDTFAQKCSDVDFKSVLLQIICALNQAQNQVGFIHGSLSLEKLKIVPLEKPMIISYKFDSRWNLVHTVRFLCILTDYTRSRGIAYDPAMDAIVSVGDLTTPADKYLDGRLLYESRGNNYFLFRKYFSILSIGYSLEQCIPMLLQMGELPGTWWDHRLFSVMQHGNTIFSLATMTGLSDKQALEETLDHVLCQGVFDSELELFTALGRELFRFRGKWLNETMMSSHLKSKWQKFTSLVSSKKTYKWFPSFSYPRRIYSEPVNSYTAETVTKEPGDWIALLDLIRFAFLMRLLPVDHPSLSLFHCEGFDLLRNIAVKNDRLV